MGVEIIGEYYNPSKVLEPVDRMDTATRHGFHGFITVRCGVK
jgi:hypothetical protein